MRKYITLLVLLLAVFSVSCEWNDVDEANAKYGIKDTASEDVVTVTDTLKSIKVAVVLPLDNSYGPRFKNVAQWALDSIKSATKGISYSQAPEDVSGLSITLEWYDENTIDIASTAAQLANRQDIAAIIGPMFSSDTYEFAMACSKTGKNILLPCTTSSEVVRKFSSKSWFWSFAETDIRQCQVMLQAAIEKMNASSVSLIASTSFYGQTFINWLPFEAKEDGIALHNIYTYDTDYLDEATAELAMEQSEAGEVIICTPGEVSDVLTIQSAVKNKNPKGTVIYGDIAMDPSLLEYPTLFNGAYGIGIFSDLESDFENVYYDKFMTTPTEGECQFYDALVLMSIVEADLYDQGVYDIGSSSSDDDDNILSDPYYYNDKVSDALTRILTPGSIDELFLTKSEDIRAIVTTKLYNLRGASGHLDFDKANSSSVAHSSYQLWTIQSGVSASFNTVETYTEAAMSTDAWESEVTNISDIQTSDVSITYPVTDKNWALLVAGSTDWSDYRHQANVLKVYNMLKDNGYDDDHIVLVMEDNIVSSSNNSYKGKVLDNDGNNLYGSVKVDYKPSNITSADIENILTGQSSDKLTKVISADSDDNILVYWTGNGTSNGLELADDVFTSDEFRSLATTMSAGSRMYRKMLWIVDASHAEAVTSLPESLGIPGVLCINSSSANETSLADQCDFDETLEVYLSTHFTKVLVSELSKSTTDTYYELYEKLARNTSGSHVNVSNYSNYSNLKTSILSEFME